MKKLFGCTLSARNVNDALPAALGFLRDHGFATESRGLKTIRVPGPFSTIYDRPEERVLFDPVRDANPFFHLIESLWVLAGSCYLALPRHFLNRYADFSDNGRTLHGAYGHRLRSAFGFDQLEAVIKLLKDKPDTRQAVLGIWSPAMDLGMVTKDMPCNDMVMLDIVDGRLNMTVCNRSNDAIWGAYGANVVQFSMLQEYIATSVGVERGYYVQQSNNFHVYEDNPYWQKFLAGEDRPQDLYTSMLDIQATPIAENAEDAAALVLDAQALDRAANYNKELHDVPMNSTFGQHTLIHVLAGYHLYKNKEHITALDALSRIRAGDWRMAMMNWVQRRMVAA